MSGVCRQIAVMADMSLFEVTSLEATVKQAVGGPTVTSGRMSPDHNILSFDAVADWRIAASFIVIMKPLFLSAAEQGSGHR